MMNRNREDSLVRYERNLAILPGGKHEFPETDGQNRQLP